MKVVMPEGHNVDAKWAALFVVTDKQFATEEHTPIKCGDRTIFVRAQVVETVVGGRSSIAMAYTVTRRGEHMSNTTLLPLPEKDAAYEAEMAED